MDGRPPGTASRSATSYLAVCDPRNRPYQTDAFVYVRDEEVKLLLLLAERLVCDVMMT